MREIHVDGTQENLPPVHQDLDLELQSLIIKRKTILVKKMRLAKRIRVHVIIQIFKSSPFEVSAYHFSIFRLHAMKRESVLVRDEDRSQLFLHFFQRRRSKFTILVC